LKRQVFWLALFLKAFPSAWGGQWQLVQKVVPPGAGGVTATGIAPDLHRLPFSFLPEAEKPFRVQNKKTFTVIISNLEFRILDFGVRILIGS
jgi:hypothetical protein